MSDETLTDGTDKNIRTIESNSTRITTLEQLIDICKIDLSVWMIDRYVINKWEVGRKAQTKDIQISDGVITGEISDSGGINVEPLFQVKVTLVRRCPEKITPVIQPIMIKVASSKRQTRYQDMKTALIISDTQIGFSRDIETGELTPYHDEVAMDAIAQVAEELAPDKTVIIGDYIDWSGWSDKYIIRPEFYFTAQPALLAGAKYLGRLRKATRGDMFFLEGNHDQRVENQMIKHLSAAYKLRPGDDIHAPAVMSIDNLLGLSRMGIQFVGSYPDSEVWINDTTKVIHGFKVRSETGKTASSVVKDANENVIFGHIHRRELASKTIATRTGYKTVTAFCPGCLCHVDGRVPGSKKTDQWQQGSAIVWYNNDRMAIVPLDIFNGTTIYDGRLYTGTSE